MTSLPLPVSPAYVAALALNPLGPPRLKEPDGPRWAAREAPEELEGFLADVYQLDRFLFDLYQTFYFQMRIEY